ncbi:hypothetical protein ABQJ54_08665 [Rhodanobacter sp. Si-c]|uniref:Uncharacterized protein n=1 Tax=Rhodanobacter lycopersici TaxID=3162487 RepID=A0ABV3QDP1_9GAMM
MYRLAHPLVLCCAGLLLCGCHHHDGSPVEPIANASGKAPAAVHTNQPAAANHATPATAATVPAPAASTGKAAIPSDNAFRVATLTLGSAIDTGYAVTAPATRFADDTPVIYASVATTGRTAGATLEARWRYLEGQGVLVNELRQTVAANGPAVTTFKVQNPNRWPAGKYSVEISLNGKSVASRDFEIGKR